MVRLGWLVSQFIPPALLTYFGRTFYVCTTEIGPVYIGTRRPVLGALYALAAGLLIPSVFILFIRLYFLPSSQSISPKEPPPAIRNHEVIFECLPPAEVAAVKRATGLFEEYDENADEDDQHRQALVNRCWKGKCRGRWKPARARHCSECGTCRAGFDHHCAFFANCLTAPYLPTFMCLLTLTPLVIVILSSPLYVPLGKRAVEAYRASWLDPSIRGGWYEWKWSWVIAAGPIGRYVTGTVLGWRTLDRVDGGGTLRTEMGIIIAIGIMLSLLTSALGFATAGAIRNGHLTVDRERARSLSRARAAVDSLRKAGKPVPSETIRSMERFIDRHYFWVPDSTLRDGRIVEYRHSVGPYDRGQQGNWEFIMGSGWSWILPWVAMSRGISLDTALNWPLAPHAKEAVKGSLEGVSSPT